MFTLNPALFGDFDLRNARDFVQYWRQLYREYVTIFRAEERINYFAEIDPTRPLTLENVRRLLRWRDPKFLTHVIVPGPNAGRLNPKVERIAEDLAH